MYLDFEDARPETPTIERAISLREGVLISVFLHLAIVALLVLAPEIPFVREALERARLAQQQRQVLLEERRREQQQVQRFVFVQPRLDVPAPAPPPRAEASDRDRVARSPERATRPTNPLPFSRGTTSERVEAMAEPAQRARGQGAAPEPGTAGAPAPPEPASRVEFPAGGDRMAYLQGSGPGSRPDTGAGAVPRVGSNGGSLGEALRNLQRYVQEQNFDNPGGGGPYGPAIQFDTKGVEFGPWIRRFVAQVRRNWFIPYAAMSMSGHVVLTFHVQKDGRLTDLTIVKPSSVEAFNHSAFNALAASNPTQPLPPEYPSDRAFFTVTFYFNEQPPSP